MQNGRQTKGARATNARGSRTGSRARRPRPSTDQLFDSVVELVTHGSGAFKGTARRYSLCAADAEDAYQRGLEILITKAPTADTSELRPWLHTVVKHEALAIRRQRERMLAASPDSPRPVEADNGRSPEDGIGERERARQTAEALSQLKSSEVQCLLLKALGYSYDEISTRTGFSWTKVNRSLTEGRKRFFDRFAQIQSGKRCERFEALLSAASDGEAPAGEEPLLKAHLRACPGCRAVLRDYRAIPSRLAEVLPPAVIAPLLHRGSWWSRLYDSITVGTGDRTALLGHKIQQAGELLTAQKTAAVVASTAALAGGAVVHEQSTRHHRPAHQRPHLSAEAPTSPPADPEPPATPARPEAPHPDEETPSQNAPDNGPPPAQAETRPHSGGEFSPEPAAPVPTADPAPVEESFDPLAPRGRTSARRNGGVANGGQEFAP